MKHLVAVLWIGLALWFAPVAVSAQEAPRASDDQVAELKALVFALQTRLNQVEKELAREKTLRTDLEEAELKRARETLEAPVKRKLGLPVPPAPHSDTPAAPGPPK